MTGLVVRESVTLAGMAERARVARGFVGGVLGGGRGLELVAGLAARWGWRRGSRTVTWFELRHG